MSSQAMTVDVLVIGAGLSGLSCATLLLDAGFSVRVLEARQRCGGRIHSVYTDERAYLADLGPSWVWPRFQPIVQRWLARLGVDTFTQYVSGDALLDDNLQQSAARHFLPAQLGMARLQGGPQALIERLVVQLPEYVLTTSAPVQSITIGADSIEVTIKDALPLTARQVVVAVPPRVALSTIRWQPELPETLTHALRATPTWMAAHAKAVAIYAKPFWRELGLSGRIASQVGPLAEVHDHCGENGTPAALFGFVGWPHESRARAGEALNDAIVEQLIRCFGADAPAPLAVHCLDWSSEIYTASADDLRGPMQHPSVGPEVLRQGSFENRLWFAGAECAVDSPGLIEGALSAAEQTSAALQAIGR